jgi:hypothetical protein
MRRFACVIALLMAALLPASADFGVGGGTIGFWNGASRSLQITYIAQVSQSSSGSDIVLMSNIHPGDLLIGVEGPAHAAGVPANTGWSGWGGYNGATCTTGTNTRYRLFALIATGTEDGTTVTGFPDSDSDKKAVLQFRANRPLTALPTGSAVISLCSATNPAAQTMLATTPGTYPIIGIATFRANGGTVSPRTTSITPNIEVDIGGVGGMYVHAYIQNGPFPAVANYTWDMDDEGTQNFLNGNVFSAFN